MRYLFIFALFSITTGCVSESKEVVPDVSEIEVKYRLARFEQILTNILRSSQKQMGMDMIPQTHEAFYKTYFKSVLPIRGFGTKDFLPNIDSLWHDQENIKLYNRVTNMYGDFKSEKAEIDQAYKYMSHYFPQFVPPNVYTFISDFGNQVFLYEDQGRDGVGIGLDMFLGEEFPYTQFSKENPAFSAYLSRTFNRDHITRKVMYMIIDDMIGPPAGDRLLDHMIHNGKKLYILDKVIPMAHDSIVMEYSREEIHWVEESELSMWAFFFDQDLFYETNSMKINKYISASPNSPGMPADAPGRTANYMGWQIVKAYMNKHQGTSLDQLIELQDAQLIMDKSRYKPRRK